MPRQILLGDEAVALGAVHAGLSAAYSYPGTPASEILEYLVRQAGETKAFTAVWSVNEKTAYEEALGASFAGKRALVSFKHVGLNVAADPFMNSAITGANGGFLVVSADDPGMHSSQNEQDSRFYAQFAQIPVLRAVRPPGGLRHGPGGLRRVRALRPARHDAPGHPPLPQPLGRGDAGRRGPRTRSRRAQGKDWILLPVNARRRFSRLLDLQAEMIRFSEELPLQRPASSTIKTAPSVSSPRASPTTISGKPSPRTPPRRPSSRSRPILFPKSSSGSSSATSERSSSSRTAIRSSSGSSRGCSASPARPFSAKLSGPLPASGELTPDIVRRALGREPLAALPASGLPLAGRPPQLCVGCPHADTFKALNKALEGVTGANVFSDIGCYTLGALPPYNAIHSCVCMGASISMARGASDAGLYPAVSVIGDSTFAHSGLTPLLGAAAANTDMTVIILDNATTAMTGGQPTYGSGPGLLRLVEGLGVAKEHIRTIEPLPKNHDKNVQIIKDEIAHRGLSVIVAVRECVQEQRKKRS